MASSAASKDAIVIEHTFDAPVGLIWQMWTVPERFKAWYGPRGFTVPVAEVDVRVGGKHLFCIDRQTPDGPEAVLFDRRIHGSRPQRAPRLHR